ncbi:hypothetical protein K470DRAFT_259469 [Piedraia hortae CBS 480.64]|uniref:CAP-Gly domain-containing protein n=1 Tax=Piedraia hortae CBS 480.64 TaxID=1314780 RepID=A0A6A7BUD5_9PEZI|nr:hypothetical protein K470DRAFT_259469 [Piedraia hortae CBS 480.64]
MAAPQIRRARPSLSQTANVRRGSIQPTSMMNASANGHASSELEVGDSVKVPGDMLGTVRYVGNVAGKPGRFVGVELSREFAARGKNDGDVDGKFYFKTTIPKSGIFLPVHRAEKQSYTASFDPPNTPLTARFNQEASTSPGTAVGAKHHSFSQTIGPGARAASPVLRPKRPSLSRPESPIHRTAANPAPQPTRGFSQSMRGPRPGTTPGRPGSFKASTSRVPSQTPRPFSRTGSRLGHNDTEGRGHLAQTLRASPSKTNVGEIALLQKEIADRDKRLADQAKTLAEMEKSLKELSALVPNGGEGDAEGDDEDLRTTAQLRQALREKNEKIAAMTKDFDSHRADFRSTLDSLEMASTETERVYEEQKRHLLSQIADLQAENDELRSTADGVDVGNGELENITAQLKQLEELVAELEEGLEESRRCEAEARGEVEFLRGEVERNKAENRAELESKEAELKSLKELVKNQKSQGNVSVVNGGHKNGVNGLETNGAKTKETKTKDKTDEDKWCALCEKEGHLAFDCPEEQY